MQFKQNLQNLIQLEKHYQGKSDWFLSVYLPNKNYGVEKAKERLRPLVLNKLKGEEFKKKKLVEEKVWRAVERKMDLVEDLLEGLAVFVQFNSEKAENPKDKTDEALPIVEMFSLVGAPKEETYLGKAFDLDQYIWISNAYVKTAVLNIKKGKGKIYFLENNKLTEFKRFENLLPKEEGEDQYLEKVSPIEEESPVYYSTGFDNQNRREEEAEKRFLGNIREFIEYHRDSFSDCGYFLVFYSKDYQEIIKDELIDRISNLFPQGQVSWMGKNFSDEEDIKKESLKKIDQLHRENRARLLKEAREAYPQYSEGWSKVVRASRIGAIDTLFIRPTASKKGYVKDREFVYLSEEGEPVENIAPWLVKSVINQGGELVILDDSLEIENLPEIAAKLRFA